MKTLKENKVESLAGLWEEIAMWCWEWSHPLPLFSQDCSMDHISISKCFKYGMHMKERTPMRRGLP
eukprot:12894039-Prorocentrum_lima.AAC.1